MPTAEQTLRRALKRLARDPGPWSEQLVAELSRDGAALLIGATVPLPAAHARTTPAGAGPPLGRKAEVPLALILWLRGHPRSYYSDIMDAMLRQGFSRSQAAEALAKLVQLGLAIHPGRGSPYDSAV